MTTTTQRERKILARVTAHAIEFFGDTYPVRREIQRQGGVWDADKQVWRVTPASPGNIAWATTLAHAVETDHAPQPQQQEPQPMPEPDVPPQPAPSVTTRRISRAKGPQGEFTPVTPVQPQTQPQTQQQTDIAAALAAFVATVAPHVQPQQQAPQVDMVAIRDLISHSITQAVAPLEAKLADRVATRVDVVTPTETRSIDGLHHRLLPDLIKTLSCGLNVWLAGPSGSGKTHAAEQAASALNLTFRLQGAMTMAHELTGFVDAGGKYHETPFVTSFRNGGLILLDELDAGSNEALLALNSALANGVMALPNGEILRKHPDFRCIGAANTFGQGATADYVGRTRIDAAFLQRFPVRLDWQYDEQLERAMTPNGNTQWAERVQNARRKAKEAGLKVLITPRFTIAGATLIGIGYTPDQAAAMTYLADLTPAQRQQIGG